MIRVTNGLNRLGLAAWSAQLVEHYTGIAKVMGSNPLQA